MIVLGIDGGGSSTRAALADHTGQVLGRGAAGPSNPLSMGASGAQKSVDAAVEAAWKSAAMERRPADAAALGIAGLASGELHRLVVELGQTLSLCKDPARAIVTHDLAIALSGGLAGAPGAVLVAGTGSACYARNTDGAEALTGGKGALLGDSGSGYWVALRGLRTAVKQFDGRAPRTGLADAALAFLGIEDASELIPRLHRGGLTTPEVAEFCPQVMALAGQGDTAAAPIVAAAQAALAAMVKAAASQAGISRLALVFAGGLALADPFKPGLEDAITAAVPSAIFPSPMLSPVGGAVLSALQNAGVPATPDVLERLAASL